MDFRISLPTLFILVLKLVAVRCANPFLDEQYIKATESWFGKNGTDLQGFLVESREDFKGKPFVIDERPANETQRRYKVYRKVSTSTTDYTVHVAYIRMFKGHTEVEYDPLIWLDTNEADGNLAEVFAQPLFTYKRCNFQSKISYLAIHDYYINNCTLPNPYQDCCKGEPGEIKLDSIARRRRGKREIISNPLMNLLLQSDKPIGQDEFFQDNNIDLDIHLDPTIYYDDEELFRNQPDYEEHKRFKRMKREINEGFSDEIKGEGVSERSSTMRNVPAAAGRNLLDLSLLEKPKKHSSYPSHKNKTMHKSSSSPGGSIADYDTGSKKSSKKSSKSKSSSSKSSSYFDKLVAANKKSKSSKKKKQEMESTTHKSKTTTSSSKKSSKSNKSTDETKKKSKNHSKTNASSNSSSSSSSSMKNSTKTKHSSSSKSESKPSSAASNEHSSTTSKPNAQNQVSKHSQKSKSTSTGTSTPPSASETSLISSTTNTATTEAESTTASGTSGASESSVSSGTSEASESSVSSGTGATSESSVSSGTGATSESSVSSGTGATSESSVSSGASESNVSTGSEGNTKTEEGDERPYVPESPYTAEPGSNVTTEIWVPDETTEKAYEAPEDAGTDEQDKSETSTENASKTEREALNSTPAGANGQSSTQGESVTGTTESGNAGENLENESSSNGTMVDTENEENLNFDTDANGNKHVESNSTTSTHETHEKDGEPTSSETKNDQETKNCKRVITKTITITDKDGKISKTVTETSEEEPDDDTPVIDSAESELIYENLLVGPPGYKPIGEFYYRVLDLTPSVTEIFVTSDLLQKEPKDSEVVKTVKSFYVYGEENGHYLLEDKLSPYTGTFTCPYEKIEIEKVDKSLDKEKLVDFHLSRLRAQCVKNLKEHMLKLFDVGLIKVKTGLRVKLDDTHKFFRQRILNRQEWLDLISAVFFATYTNAFMDSNERISRGAVDNRSPDGRTISWSVRTLSLMIFKGMDLLEAFGYHIVKLIRFYANVAREKFLELLKTKLFIENTCGKIKCVKELKVNHNDRMVLMGLMEFAIFGVDKAIQEKQHGIEMTFNNFYKDTKEFIKNRVMRFSESPNPPVVTGA